ncbi:SIS domain-containing protein [Zophobihabitans entericus]|uniref:SIS domain-containing protein n=1 Tax=Zophobihabitans entericus TaxID=1635327 RepID=A0A6G9IBT4_9GAMM|nr:SIS domain-containing protein [Zophobihabitans entericus]QIQ21040.1 SIS domain-containing protein [Zophobihabitans entericus]
MNTYFSYSDDWLNEHNAHHTAREISHQPQIWENVWTQLNAKKDVWQDFLKPLLADPELEIILTGAGSSAFAGVTLAPWLREHTGLNARAYGSTEIVANPLQYFSPKKKTLVVSYARSGNSPESVAAVKLADQLIENCYHLFITCNPNSALTKYATGSNKICELVMPEGTHDLSFAMTSSISSMMLATILVMGVNNFEESQQNVKTFADICRSKLNDWQEITKSLAKQPFERIVYVGSSCFTGIAQEAALKVLELTAGKIATRFDSILGLRHGPKFMIDNKTLVVCFLSGEAYTRQYDYDLFNEISHDHIAKCVIALSGKTDSNENILSLDTSLDDIWLIFPYLLFAQMVAFEKSLSVGLTPDNPCPTGEVNRVVKGVNIYPFSKQ